MVSSFKTQKGEVTRTKIYILSFKALYFVLFRKNSFLSLKNSFSPGNNSHGGRERTAKRRVTSAVVEPLETRPERPEEVTSTSVLNRWRRVMMSPTELSMVSPAWCHQVKIII